MRHWKFLLGAFVLLLLIIFTKVFLYDASLFGGTFASKYFPLSYEQRFLLQKQQSSSAPFVTTMDTELDYQEYCHEHQEPCLLFAHQELFAVMHWLRDIQYVGGMINREEVPFFNALIESLTEMTPYWPYPYVFAQMFGPINKDATLDEETKYLSWKDAAQLGERGTYFTCDLEKVEKIGQLSEKDFLQAYKKTNSDLSSPCVDYRLPHNLAFTYFYYLQDYAPAQKWYRVAAFDPAAPDVTASMSALVAGSLGYHLKSMSLWLEKYLVLFEDIDAGNGTEELLTEAQRYVNKAVMEYSLYLIQQADESAQSDGVCFRDIDCLYDQGYLSQVIKDEVLTCRTFVGKDLSQNHACFVLDYALQYQFIALDGNLRYPFAQKDSSASYGWHPVMETWWIVSK